LYRHFPARDALLEAVYHRQVAKLAAAERDEGVREVHDHSFDRELELQVHRGGVRRLPMIVSNLKSLLETRQVALADKP
jgi:AcrR family transcriptional regulator